MLQAIAAMPDVQARFETVGLEASASTADEFRDLMKREMEMWTRVVKEANIQAID